MPIAGYPYWVRVTEYDTGTLENTISASMLSAKEQLENLDRASAYLVKLTQTAITTGQQLVQRRAKRMQL